MGVHTRAAIAARLIERGWPASTPAALLFAASTPQRGAWIGTLADLARPSAAGAPTIPDGPGTIVIGDVVALAQSTRRRRAATRRADDQRRTRERGL